MARKTAEERREQIVAIAFRHFAAGGYHGTSTEAIAREAGISQPYLFRLFGTKRGLFTACVERCYADVIAVFREAAAGVPAGEERLQAMGKAYVERLLRDRVALQFQMQAFAVAPEPELRDAVRQGYCDVVNTVIEVSEAPLDMTWTFFANGMLMNLIAVFDLHGIEGPEDWAASWAHGGPL
jgi:AcrR family transcriptional regulator